VEFILSQPGAARADGRLTLGRDEQTALEQGLLYFDVHTRQHPEGVARAQVR
jgi:hypothetical protein